MQPRCAAFLRGLRRDGGAEFDFALVFDPPAASHVLRFRLGSVLYQARVLVGAFLVDSFHHRFPSDFRNGIRWFHWDPAKWFIRLLKLCGLAWDLMTVPTPVIEEARVAAAAERSPPELWKKTRNAHVMA